MMEVFGSIPPPPLKDDSHADASPTRTAIVIETIAHHRRRRPLARAMAWLLHQLHLDGHIGRAA